MNVSYKPQTIKPKFAGTVRQLLHSKIQRAYVHPQVTNSHLIFKTKDFQFITDVMKPLTMENLMDLEVQTLSGGELQRVAIVLALGKPADVSA